MLMLKLVSRIRHSFSVQMPMLTTAIGTRPSQPTTIPLKRTFSDLDSAETIVTEVKKRSKKLTQDIEDLLQRTARARATLSAAMDEFTKKLNHAEKKVARSRQIVQARLEMSRARKEMINMLCLHIRYLEADVKQSKELSGDMKWIRGKAILNIDSADTLDLTLERMFFSTEMQTICTTARRQYKRKNKTCNGALLSLGRAHDKLQDENGRLFAAYHDMELGLDTLEDIRRRFKKYKQKMEDELNTLDLDFKALSEEKNSIAEKLDGCMDQFVAGTQGPAKKK